MNRRIRQQESLHRTFRGGADLREFVKRAEVGSGLSPHSIIRSLAKQK